MNTGTTIPSTTTARATLYLPLPRARRTRAAPLAACIPLLLVACQGGQESATPLADAPMATTLQPVSDAREPSPGLPRWIANSTPDATPDKVRDAAISAAVSSALTREPTLNGYHIDVDNAGGRVILAGLAPNAVARWRATELAARVEGVAVVQNQLSVAPPGLR